MSKRGAESQKTKDGESSEEESEIDPSARETPLAPVQGRVIRGLPKRGTAGTPSSAPAASATAVKPLGSGFAFGSSTTSTPSFSLRSAAAPSTTNPTTPTFGFPPSTNPPPATASADAPTASPFDGFTFAKPSAPTTDASGPFDPSRFGAGPTDSLSTQRPDVEAAQSAPKMAFSAFSFSAMPAEPSASAESTALRDTSARNPTGGSGATARFPTPPPEPKTTSQQLATPASSFNSSSIPAALTPLPAFNPQNGPLPTLPSPPPENEVSYYTFLRGLNTSFVSFLSQSIDSDPFLDLTQCLPGLLHQYELHLEEAAAKAGKGPQGTKPAPIAQASISRPPDNTVKPPAPSSVGSFTLLKASTPSALPSSGGFVPTLPAAGSSSSPFSFGAFGATKLAETAAPPKVAVAPAAKKPSAEVMELIDEVMAERPEEEKAPDAPRPFSFTTPTPTSTPEPKKSTPLFSFAPSGPLHKTTPESKTFYPSANVEAASPPPGLGKFGPGGSTPQLTFGGAKPSGSGTLATKPSFGASQTGFSFGSSSSSPVFSIGADSSGETSKSAAPSFSFGVKPANSAPNPTTFAFSFGTNPSTRAPKSTAPAFSFGSTTPPFAFGTPSSAGPSEAPSADESADATPEPIEPSKNLAESVGAGEEGEDTVIEQRGKLYHLEEGKFGLVGLGQFKVKRAKKGESGKRKRRLLMRTDGGGNVVLNMALPKTFNPSVEGATIRFLGFDLNGKPRTYMLRVKTGQSATDLVEAMLKEVEAANKE